MWRKVWFGVVGALVIAGANPSVVRADDPMPPMPGWTFKGGLYGWLPWVQGDNTARDLTFDVYADPIDVLKALDKIPLMARFEATRGKLSIFADVMYSEFAFGSDVFSEKQPIPQLNATSRSRTSAGYDFGIYQAGAFYQIASFAGQHGDTALEVGAGVRALQNEISIQAEIDVSTQIELGKLADRIKQRIRRIEDREQRLEALSALNALRDNILSERIVRSEDRGRERRVARLDRRLKRVDRRGQALAALEAFRQLQLALLQRALNLDGQQSNRRFAIVDSGSMDWVDPTIALRMQHQFGNGRAITAMGDFGGFNVDDGMSWQALLTYDIEGTLFGYETVTSLGYKALWLKYEDRTSNGARGMDVVLHGPIGEVLFRW